MRLFALPNLSATTVKEVKPWEVQIERPVFNDKVEYVNWCKHPSTQSCHYSAFEGLAPSLRVTLGSNDPLYLHAFVADYDTPINDNMLQTLNQRSVTEFMPVWMCKTYSGGCRLIWEFESPLLLTNAACTKAFVKLAIRKMGFKKILPGFDEASSSMQLYYELGRDWQRVSSDTIPANLLWQWMFEASQSVDFQTKGQVVIPETELALAVEKQFPGRWRGEFAYGARGIRFWDPDADNPTAAVVRESGMQCFTGPQGFVSWAEIFGTAFVEKFKADCIGEIIKDWVHDGRQYWRKKNGSWETNGKEEFRLYLKATKHISPKCGKSGISAVDQVVAAVNEQKRVKSVLPKVFFPDGIYRDGSLKILNTCMTRCMEPTKETGITWGQGFPWLAAYLENFFDPAEQLDYFLAWLKRFYENSYKLAPLNGQNIFIGGAAGVGKTFLSTVVIAKMVGGSQDACGFLVEGKSQFNEHIFEKGLLTIDDASANSSFQAHQKFMNNVKKLAANNKFEYEKKFCPAGQITWIGRLVVTCNLDAESIRILPTLTASDADKTCFFRANSKSGVVFKPSHEMDTLMNQELPFFCRWLLEWEYPEHTLGEIRYGVKAYHETSMLNAAGMSDTANEFSEILDIWRTRYYMVNKDKEDQFWMGSASSLLANIVTQPDLEQLARSYTSVRGFGRLLGKITTEVNSVVSVVNSGRSRYWKIDCSRETLPKLLLEQVEAGESPL